MMAARLATTTITFPAYQSRIGGTSKNNQLAKKSAVPMAIRWWSVT
jgi:hypothetical protein